MKTTRLLLSFTILSVLSIFLSSNIEAPVIYKFKATESKIAWSTTAEDGTKHNGNLKFKSGTMKVDVKTLLSAYTYINTQSLKCNDVEDEGFNRELITEMRSAEQLNITKYKEATLKITKAKRLDVAEGKPNYDITAILKLKGLSIPVNFKANMTLKKSNLTFKGNFTLSPEEAQLPYELNLKLDIVASSKK